MNFLRIVIVVVSFILVACASHEPRPAKIQGFFNTLIKRDGTKQFSYTLMMESPAGAGKRGGSRGGHGGPPPGDHGHRKGDKAHSEDKDMDDRFNLIFNESLIAKLSDTGFCQQGDYKQGGYKELDRKSRKGIIQVTGECNDRASHEDKAKFPNPPPVKVKEQVIE